jgi:hypothetical protein
MEYIKGENNISDWLSRIPPTRINSIKSLNNALSEEEKCKVLQKLHFETGHGSAENMFFIMKDKIW